MKIIKRLGILLTVICLCCPLRFISAKDSFFDGNPYVLYNCTDGYIESQFRANEAIAPGTLTQWMSALLIIENTRHFDKSFTVQFEDESSQYAYGFLHGEKTTVQDALFAMLLCGSGDMTKAAARHMAGQETEFVRLMNKKAKSLGMNDTSFVNAGGDDEAGQKTTLRDLSLLIHEVLQNKIVQKIFSFDTYTFETNRQKYTLYNKTCTSFGVQSQFDCFITETDDRLCVTGSFTYEGKTFLATSFGKTREDCIAMMTDCCQQIQENYKKLVPLTQDSVAAHTQLGYIFPKTIPVQIPSDISLVVRSSVTYEDLSYAFVPDHGALFILPGQSLGSIDIYQGNRRIKSEQIRSKKLYVCRELIILAAACVLTAVVWIWKKKTVRAD